jgi:hypothetical protein
MNDMLYKFSSKLYNKGIVSVFKNRNQRKFIKDNLWIKQVEDLDIEKIIRKYQNSFDTFEYHFDCVFIFDVE